MSLLLMHAQQVHGCKKNKSLRFERRAHREILGLRFHPVSLFPFVTRVALVKTLRFEFSVFRLEFSSLFFTSWALLMSNWGISLFFSRLGSTSQLVGCQRL